MLRQELLTLRALQSSEPQDTVLVAAGDPLNDGAAKIALPIKKQDRVVHGNHTSTACSSAKCNGAIQEKALRADLTGPCTVWLMLTRREIIVEVCLRAGVPAGRFRSGEIDKDELRAVIRAAQVLSEHELEEFEELLREIRLDAR